MNMKSRAFILLTFLIVEHAVSQNQPLQFASIFTDSMVLQRQSEVAIWGKGPAGKKISIVSSWKNKASAVVGSEGSWSAKLKTAKAGGPYQVSVSDGDTTVILKDVLLGEVWLCSGQSNMEMPLEGWPPTTVVQNSDSEISNANFPNIRFFSVKRAFAINPETSCAGKWIECNPKNVRAFSATAYFFGRTLFQQLHVPIGLINASWGGTAIESWMSKQNLSGIGDYLSILRRIEGGKDSIEALKKWIGGHPVIKIADPNPETRWQHLNFDDSTCLQKEFNDSLWREMKLPGLWEQTAVANFDGAVWFRKRIAIPSDWKGKELALELGPIDDMDETYVNGRNVGNHLTEGMYQVLRRYLIPAGQDSILQIAVRVIDYGGGGGIFGSDASLQLRRTDTTLSIPLAGTWKYLPVAEYMGGSFYVFGWKGEEYFNRPMPSIDFTGYSPTALFNGMISPLVPFALSGAIWYQGESNVGNSKMYTTLFPMMIREWRSVFQREDMPFYYVQIAPYKYAPHSQSQLLREAQFKTLALKNTGMAVTLDIGNTDNIHPANKQDVGKRLALWALAKTYKKNNAFSGPLYRSMKIKKNTIVLSFDYVGKGLVLKEHSKGNEFQIAGEDSLFKNAVLKIEGATLVVSHADIIHPKAVRYAFSDVSEATLFNKEGLPASSFRTDNFDK